MLLIGRYQTLLIPPKYGIGVCRYYNKVCKRLLIFSAKYPVFKPGIKIYGMFIFFFDGETPGLSVYGGYAREASLQVFIYGDQ